MTENPKYANGAAAPAAVEAPGRYRPKLAFFHPNGRGTGCAAELELHPAHDDRDGCIMLAMASQTSVGDRRAATPTFSRFDWEHRLVVKLGFDDLCKMLQVFRGECETIEDGKGLYHRAPTHSTRIVLRHLLEPTSAYSLEVYRTQNTGEEARAHIVFNAAEALGLAESIAGAMSVIAFGIPMLVPHDTSAYRAAVQEARHAATAAA